MKRVMDRVAERQAALEKGDFFRLLATPSPDDAKKLGFIPAMCAYVMSFRDLLRLIVAEPARSPLDEAVNAYVAEDGPHFEWYLGDLATSGIAVPGPRELWAPATLPSRRAIYRMIGYAMDEPDVAELRLMLIAIFEATGEVFLRHTRMLTERLGLNETLGYFGDKHYSDELAHTVDIRLLGDIELPAETAKRYATMVDRAFDEYAGLFQSWYLAAVEAGAPAVTRPADERGKKPVRQASSYVLGRMPIDGELSAEVVPPGMTIRTATRQGEGTDYAAAGDQLVLVASGGLELLEPEGPDGPATRALRSRDSYYLTRGASVRWRSAQGSSIFEILAADEEPSL